MKRTKKLLALLLAVVMAFGLLPATALAEALPNTEPSAVAEQGEPDAGPSPSEDPIPDAATQQAPAKNARAAGTPAGSVFVTVENTTYPKADGAAWEGTLIDNAEIPITSESTVMSAVAAALDGAGATQTGVDSGYITSVNGLGAGAPEYMSGWMGTINDWFANEGFGSFTVANGNLKSGDEIRIMFTVTGSDLGASWDNDDKTVKALKTSVGTLSPSFSKDVHAYTLTVPEGTESVCVTPTASNKNFQVRTSVDGTEYRRTQPVPVSAGKIVKVVCGDPKWPTMNTGAAEIPAETYEITVQASAAPVATFQVTPADAAVYVADADGKSVAAGETPNAFALEAGKEYTYTVSKYGYVTEHKTFTASGVQTIEVNLAAAPENTLTKYNAEWPSFRNSDSNMGIVDAKTPRTADETELLWATKMSSGWSSSVSSPIIVGDKLYVMAGSTIKKIDKATGTVEATTGTAAASGGFTVHLAYGDGMIFAPVGNGQIQAFDANTLQSLWISEKLGGQTLTPLTYANGYLYTGFRETGDAASFVCLSVTDEDPGSTNETKYPTWVKKAPDGAQEGYYWSGACVVGDTVVFGVDTGLLTSYSAAQNKEIDTFQADGDIRSSVAKDGDRLYFTTKAGRVYSIRLNADGTFDKGSVKSGQAEGITESTSTPVVYNGRVYVGGSGASFTEGTLAVMDANDLSTIYSAKIGGKAQSSALLTTAYHDETGKVYAYFTYNNNPGGVTVLEDAPGQTEAKISELFIPAGDKAQYCICSPIADADGTIYYKNDSGYVMALGAKDANKAPARKAGVEATAEETLALGEAYELDLSTIFEDADNDPLTYKVSIDGAEAIAAAENYAYAPAQAGTATLVFTANDGKDDSRDTYTVTLTVTDSAAVLADITQAVEGVPVSGSSGLRVRETDRDDKGNDVPVTNIEQTWQLRMKRTDIAVSVISSGNANIGANGDITYTDAQVKGSVSFRFTKNGVSYEKEVLVTVPAHTRTVQEQIDALAALFATDAGFDLIKGANTAKDDVREPLNLQKSPGNYSGLAGYSDTELLWESSDTAVINPPSYGSSSVKVNRPALGEQDAQIDLKVTIKKSAYASGSGAAKTVTVPVTVPAVTQAEYDEAKAAVDAALKNVTLTGFTESGSLGKTVINPSALDYDIQLKDITDLISAGMVENNAVNKSMAWAWSADGTAADGNYLSVNYLACRVMRTVGTADKDTNLKLTLTYNGYSGTKTFPVTIKGITQDDVDAVNAEMKDYEKAIWEGLKGKNTDPDFVTYDLGWDRDNDHVVFYRIHKEGDDFVYTLKNSSAPGNAGVEFDSWKSSDPTVIGQSTDGYVGVDLLQLKKRPDLGEEVFHISLNTNMTNLRYKNVKNADGSAAVPAAAVKMEMTVPAYTNELESLAAERTDLVFDPAKDSFTAEVPKNTNEVRITAAAKDPAATVTINGEEPDENDTVTIPFTMAEMQVPIVTTVQGQAKTVTLTLAGEVDPMLSEGSFARASDTEASILFTSSKAGSVYYAIVDKGTAPPQIGTTGEGVAVTTGKNTLALERVTAGAKDIYAVLKDAKGNVSVSLKIEMPQYSDVSAKLIENPELSTGIFWTPMFEKGRSGNVRFAYTHVPTGTESFTFTFKAPEGVEIYDGAKNKLMPDAQGVYSMDIAVTAAADNDMFVPDWLMGKGGQSVTFQMKYGTQTADYRLNVLRRPLQEGLHVVDYLCVGSQYTNNGNYGLYPERTLMGGTSWDTPVSLGGFGGYITYKLDDPVTNDPKNPCGIDFLIYGNGGGPGFSEPGNVYVSKNGTDWYMLAGSDYFDDNTEWGYELTYTGGDDNKIHWEDRHGKTGTMTLGQHPPKNENYPMAAFDPSQPMTVTGALLKSSAKDDYGTPAAAVPDWGYADAQTNSEGNPYTGDNTRGGGGFDLSWAVDADGNPVKLDSIQYIKVATASHVDGGAIGEKSTEVNAVLRVQAKDAEVGKTAAPAGITVNGRALRLADGVYEYGAYFGDGEVQVDVDAAEGANVYINNAHGASRTYEAAPEKGIVRVVVQEGEKEPLIYYITAQTEQEALPQIKEDAKDSLDTYKDADDYRAAQKTELADAISDGKDAIGRAADIAGVESALAAAKEAMDAIKTDAQLTAEELTAAKEAAKTELENYKDADDYRAAQKTELATAIEAGKTAIDSVGAIADVDGALAAAKAEIDKIKTDAQLTAEELAAAKSAAKTELEHYRQASDYREAERALWEAAVAQGKANIGGAADKAAVQDALAAAKAEIDKIKTDAQLTAEENAAAAKAVDGKIGEIGTVTLESKAKIDIARAAYDALNSAQKALVTKLNTLKAAEAKYKELKDAADKLAADKAAAKAVDGLIDGIGTVTLEKEGAIKDARTAYDALTSDQKAHVQKYDVLKEAESALQVLQVKALIDSISDDVTFADQETIAAAEKAYGALSGAQKGEVGNALKDKLDSSAAEMKRLEDGFTGAAVKAETSGGIKHGTIKPEQLPLTNEEKTAVAKGAELKTHVAMSLVTEQAVAEDARRAKEILGENTIIAYLDISLFKQVGDGERTAVGLTHSPLTLTFDVPAEWKATAGTTRTFQIIRVHNGVAETLKDLDSNPDTITIETDRFSTYAVTYQDQKPVTGTNNNTTNTTQTGGVKTGDTQDIWLYVILAAIAAGAAAAALVLRRRKKNA